MKVNALDCGWKCDSCCDYLSAIVAKSISEPKQFHADPEWMGFNYAGLVVPLEVHQVLRGPIEAKAVIPVHFVVGSGCGVSPDILIPDSDELYVVAGKLAFKQFA